MTNNSINEILNNAEGTMEIDLVNQASGATYAKAAVRGDNTLQQIKDEYHADIGIDPEKKIVFKNKRTGASTSDSSETVKGFDLREGDVLLISDSGVVAGGDMLEIDLVNKSSGATYSKAAVYGENTLDQITKEYANDIGLNIEQKLVYENKRSGQATSDSSETVKGLDLRNGDVLLISDSGVVAGEDIFKIDLVNKCSGATYSKAAVYGGNTLGQITKEYGDDIGLNIKQKLVYENKRTGQATSDSSETVKGFGLCDEDVLLITDSGGGCP